MADILLPFGNGLFKTLRDMGDGSYAEVGADQVSRPPVSATFTPAASSHTGKDVVGGAQTFAAVGVAGRQVLIIGTTFSLATTTPVASEFKLHLFNAAPTVIADDAAFTLATVDIPKYLGAISLGTPADLDSTAQWIENNDIRKPILLASADVIGYLQNITTASREANAAQVTRFTLPLT